VDEAKEVVTDNVLPVLKAMGKIMIVTGRGLHKRNLTSQLKIQIREFFVSLKVRCKDIPGNERAFYIFKK
jgi:hypothetical protein